MDELMFSDEADATLTSLSMYLNSGELQTRTTWSSSC